MFKALYGLAPTHMSDLIECPHHHDTLDLVTIFYQEHHWCQLVTGPFTHQPLPPAPRLGIAHLVHVTSPIIFRKQLKTHLLIQAFGAG